MLYIPATNEKPYLVKKWYDKKGNSQENQIFIRKGTGTFNSNKGDIDTMYYYRGIEQNIIPDYGVELGITLVEIKYDFVPQDFVNASYFGRIDFSIENLGRRQLCVQALFLICKSENEEDFILEIDRYMQKEWGGKKSDIVESVLRNGDIVHFYCGIVEEIKPNFLVENTPTKWTFYFKLVLSNGKQLIKQVKEIKSENFKKNTRPRFDTLI